MERNFDHKNDVAQNDKKQKCFNSGSLKSLQLSTCVEEILSRRLLPLGFGKVYSP